MGEFDHAIVHVDGTPGTWIDATAEDVPVGTLPFADQGRKALLIAEGTKGLTETPVAASADNLLVEHREIWLSSFGPARIVETSEPHGTVEANYRYQFGGAETKDLRKNLESYMKSVYLADALTRFDHGTESDFEHPFTMSLEAAKAKRGSTSLQDAAVVIQHGSLLSRLPAQFTAEDQDNKEEQGPGAASTDTPKKEPRTADYFFEPYVTEWQYVIHPPAGFRLHTVPEDKTYEFGPARLTQHFEAAANGTVTGKLRFDSVKGRYTAAEEAALHKAALEFQHGPALVVTFDHARASAERLLKVEPTSDLAFRLATGAMLETKDFAAAEALAQQRLKRNPDDGVAIRARAEAAEYAGDAAKAMSLLRPLIDSNKADANDLNQYAWTALFLNHVPQEAVEAADHANIMTQKQSFPILHTLGCLYAEVGKEKQAREALLAAMDANGLDEPNSEVWYGFGRIAEQYGEFEAARTAYARVEKPEFLAPSATYNLVQRRMAAMETPRNASQVAK